jgi:hypothetical protein
MSLIGAVRKATPALTGTIDPRTYRSGMSDFWLFGAGPNNSDVHFSFSSLNDSIKAYECCPPVATIVNRKAEAHINGKTWILNTQGKAKQKEATGEVASRIRKVMTQPNPLQDWTQFDAMVKVYVQLFGYCPILKIRPVGFDGSYITRLWIIPPFLLDIEESDEIFYRTDKPIKKISLNYRGKTANLDPDDIFFIKDFTVSLTSLVLPQSRIKPLANPINNIIGAFISRKVLINRRGALGILSNSGSDQIGQIPLDDEEKKRVQNELTNYGLRSDQWQVIVTNAALKWQQMGYPMKELGLFEEVNESTMTICDGLGYVYRLLSSEKTSSLGGSDIKEFKAMLYQDFIGPEATKIYDQYNVMFETAKYFLRIEKDFSEIPALQQDAVKLATARFTRNKAFQIEFLSNACTINEWRVKNGDDPISEEWGNMYYFQLKEKGIVFGSASGGNGNSNGDNQDQSDNNDTNNSNNGS